MYSALSGESPFHLPLEADLSTAARRNVSIPGSTSSARVGVCCGNGRIRRSSKSDFQCASRPPEVAQALSMALPSGGNYLDGTQVVPAGPTTFRVTPRFLPQWAVICGIIGLLLCGIGIIAVFFRDTEELVVDVHRDGAGSRVTVSGQGKPELVATIQSTLARLPGFAPQLIASSPGLPGVQPTVLPKMSDDGAWWWDGQVWKDATMSAPPGAQRSPDGQMWWDGKNWRPVPNGQGTPSGESEP